jgi:hypothetical protein
MFLLAEPLEVEPTRTPAELRSQWREAREIDPTGSKNETLGSLVQLESVTRTHAERFQHPGRERHLPLARDFYDHVAASSLLLIDTW